MPDDTNARFLRGLPRIADGLSKSVKQIDASTLAAMVGDAKARAPHETGNLVNGITGHIADGVAVFAAHAIAPDGKHLDYASFVEFGHGSGAADRDFFKGDGSAALGPSRKGGGAAPHPFFYPAMKAPLSRHASTLGALADKVLATIAKG